MTVEEIEKAVAKLSEDELARFQTWYEQFASDAWDRQIEADIKAGKLDKLADEALEEYRKGRYSEL